jgi:hypothetical protein
MLAASGGLDRRAAVPVEHVEDFLVQVALRRGGARGRYVQHEHVEEIAAAFQMHGGGIDRVAVPTRGRHLQQVDTEVFGDGDGLALQPFEIDIDADAWRIGCVHWSCLS